MQLSLIDSHCHLDFAAFAADRAQVLQQARTLGVEAFIIPAVERANWSAVLQLATQEPDCFAALGLHPCWWERHQWADIDALAQQLSQERAVVAVGECGLDWRLPESSQALQKSQLSAQLELAQHYRLPLILHSVHANDQLAALLRRYPNPRGGVIHAFGGSRQQAEQFVKLGYRLGVGGSISHPRAQRLRGIFQQLPSECWLLETDSPDMTPAFAGPGRNTPANLPALVGLLATVKGVPEAELAVQLSDNARQLFRLPPGITPAR